MKKSTVVKNVYSFEVSAQTITNLANWAQFGKNAAIVLHLAKLINKGDDLPVWFKTCLDIEHAQDLFNLPTTKMKRVLEKDTYFIIRNCVNTYLKDKELSEDQKTKLKKVLTNVVFQNNAVLNEVLNFKPEPSLLSDNKTAQALKNIKSNKLVEIETADAPTQAQTDAPSLADSIASLDLDEALKIQDLLTAHIASLQAQEVKKVG